MNINPVQLDRRYNNFDLLRLIAALLVLITHSFILRGMYSKEPLVILSSNKLNFSVLGLAIFFSISGFLVCRSVMETRLATDFLLKRFLRIWPALFVNVIFTVFVVGLIFTSLTISEYLTHPQTFKFLFFNISLFKTTQFLPGVFAGKPVNTPLWTIPAEVKLYLLLLIASKAGLLKKNY
jgi:peptidoglycan/LPS O-acetylase OafA/YrhL